MRYLALVLAILVAGCGLAGCGVKGPPQPFNPDGPEPFAEGTRRGASEGFDQDAQTVSQVGTRAGRDRQTQANVPVGSDGRRGAREGGRRFILDPLLR